MLLVMQGWPGSGKSTFANKLKLILSLESIKEVVIYSTDDYYVEGDGVYRFNPVKLGEYHKANLERSKIALDEGKIVILDNTNINLWESREYILHAVSKGLPVEFFRVTGNWKSTHNVPDHVVMKMKQNIQDLTLEGVLASKKPF